MRRKAHQAFGCKSGLDGQLFSMLVVSIFLSAQHKTDATVDTLTGHGGARSV
jgi:hypothetical protein